MSPAAGGAKRLQKIRAVAILADMAEFNDKTIEYLGQLARISLEKSEITKLKAEVTSVLDYVGKLQEIDTKNVEPTSQVTGLRDVWRADEPYPKPWNREDLLKNVPQTQDGYIKVKRVLQ